MSSLPTLLSPTRLGTLLSLLFSCHKLTPGSIVGLNAKLFLKQGGGLLISIKASCIDSTGMISYDSVPSPL